MIDLSAARTNPQAFRDALERKGAAELFDELMAADRAVRDVQPRVEELRARRKLKGKPSPEQLAELERIKDELQVLERRLQDAEDKRRELLARIPNPPHDSVPDGTTEEDAREVSRFGEPPRLDAPKDHIELGRFEMERAARVSGSRFGYWVGDTALVALALYRLALDRLVTAGFVPVLPPVLVRAEALYGTGWFPAEEANVYEVPSDELYLAGTAEIPLASLHGREILPEDDLPLRYVGFSPCFRREAGAAGKDTRGMFRVHQFNKVEMFVYTRPEESWDEHELLRRHTEGFLQALGMPYRVVTLPAGDMSAASAKTYDVECWFASQGRYRETASISNTTDYQARRLQSRYRSERGVEALHTLNGTAIVDRMALALLESFQQPDGTVAVPEVLQQYGAPSQLGAGRTHAT